MLSLTYCQKYKPSTLISKLTVHIITLKMFDLLCLSFKSQLSMDYPPISLKLSLKMIKFKALSLFLKLFIIKFLLYLNGISQQLTNIQIIKSKYQLLQLKLLARLLQSNMNQFLITMINKYSLDLHSKINLYHRSNQQLLKLLRQLQV